MKSIRVLQPLSKRLEIDYPVTVSEFDIQACVYGKLVALGYDVRGEVPRRAEFGDGKRKSRCIFDLVIYVGKVAVATIETKTGRIHGARGATGLLKTRQGRRYTEFGIPVIFAYGQQGVDEAIQYISTKFPIRG